MAVSTMDPESRPVLFFGRSKILILVVVLFIFGISLSLRLMRLTNPPLDLHAWRQLRSASIARGIYYQMTPDADPVTRQKAINLGKYDQLEPTVTETLVAYTYRLAGGVYLWIARLYTIFFWLLGGVALFALAWRLSSADGAIVSLAYYLLLPFGILISRSFLPEPLMVMWILFAIFAIYRWAETHTWKWALLAGVITGVAVFVKVFAVFPLASVLVLVVLTEWGLRRFWRATQVWAVAGISVVIPALYYVFPRPGAARSYLFGWTLPYLHMLTDVTFYISWLNRLNTYFNIAILLVAAASVMLLEKRGRALGLGLWIGYVLTGFFVPSLITSHIYYNAPLIAVIAISLAPVGSLFFTRLAQQSWFWQGLFLVVALVALAYAVFLGRKPVVAQDFSGEPARWEALAKLLPDSSLVGLTDDYNMRLKYYGWRNIAQYPHSFDIDMHLLAGGNFDENAENLGFFKQNTHGAKFFVITLMDQLDAQPYLKKILYNHYTIYAQGQDYIIFDLRNPK